MRLGSLSDQYGPYVAVETGGKVHALAPRVSDMKSVITSVLEDGGKSLRLADNPVDEPHWQLPLHPGKIVGVGLNYRDHAAESRVEPPKQPLVFAKFPSSVTGPLDPIIVDPSLTERVDWEVELAVVIGRRMRNVPVARVLDHVFGYTVANDVSARDVQFADGQWTRGKSFDTFCPLGPVIVTADEVGPPVDLHLCTRVNGESVQSDSTRNMIFSVAELLAFCSRSFTLQPGDIVLSGTPSGCGEFMDPPRSLVAGDVVEAEIAGIGTLRNMVVFRPLNAAS